MHIVIYLKHKIIYIADKNKNEKIITANGIFFLYAVFVFSVARWYNSLFILSVCSDVSFVTAWCLFNVTTSIIVLLFLSVNKSKALTQTTDCRLSNR